MRYLSIIFASMLLVGCAQSTEVETTEDVDIRSQQESSAEEELKTQQDTEVQTESAEEETESELEIESEEAESTETDTTESETTESETSTEEPAESDDQQQEMAIDPEPAPEPDPEPAPEPEPEPEPVEEETEPAGYTLADVQQNDSRSSCWSVINGNVYDLTAWIDKHPGGASRIESLCGGDGSSAFNSRHGGQSNATSTLQGYLLGPLS